MSEQKLTTTSTSSDTWSVNDLPIDEKLSNADGMDLPNRTPPPLTRMSTGAYIDGVFTTKDEMMHKMESSKVKEKEKND